MDDDAPSTAHAPPRVAIAHDWLVRYAGSERCVEEMLRVFPHATLLTTVLAPAQLPAELADARVSVLQRIPGAAEHHEWLLPLMPLAWRLVPRLRDVDAVISSSHACAKAIRVAEGIPHLCYCHTPMRYAWRFEAEKARVPAALRPLARPATAWLRAWDRRTAAPVTGFLANSHAVADRIRCAYGRSAHVVHPPVRTDFFTPGGEREDFFLFVGRLVAYKRADLAVEAFAGLPHRLVVVGSGGMETALRRRATPNVDFRPDVDDEELRRLYRSARALVHPGEEDFGIVMAEAQACGTPVLAPAAGGALDIVEPGRNGWLLRGESVRELRRTVALAAREEPDAHEISSSAARFSAGRFRREIRAAVERAIEAARRARRIPE